MSVSLRNAEVRIGERVLANGRPCFIIAEAGVNHNGDLALARALVDAAAESGADAVKFQTFKADRLASARAPKARYQSRGAEDSESQQAMLRRLEMPREAYAELAERARELGLVFLSTPFDEESVDFLDRLGVPAFKVASCDITHLGLLEFIARRRRPVILSTGMSTMEEVSLAVEAMAGAGAAGLVLLHCVSCYPADPADVNLRAMATMADVFGVPVGFSDHTEGTAIAVGAAALGAAVIEKHLTIDRSLPGPDHRASLEPAEFARMVRGIRDVQRAIGDGRKRPVDAESGIAAIGRRSLVAARDLRAGERLSADAIAVRRPGTGLPPSMRAALIGRTLAVDVGEGELLSPEMLA